MAKKYCRGSQGNSPTTVTTECFSGINSQRVYPLQRQISQIVSAHKHALNKKLPPNMTEGVPDPKQLLAPSGMSTLEPFISQNHLAFQRFPRSPFSSQY